MKHLDINNIRIEIERKKIKHMHLRVLPPEGKIHISAPFRMPEEEIRRLILSKYEWIEKQQQKMQQRPDQKVLEYVSGEEIYFSGKKYKLCVIPSENNIGVILMEDKLILKSRTDSTSEVRAQILSQWHREALMEMLPQLITKWEKIIGVKTSSFVIRDMKTRWGSCNVRTGRVCFNLRLARKKPICLEYVVVHELVHLLEGSHNKVFKGYMDQFLPNWRAIKKELND